MAIPQNQCTTRLAGPSKVLLGLAEAAAHPGRALAFLAPLRSE